MLVLQEARLIYGKKLLLEDEKALGELSKGEKHLNQDI
jgi:hypothetical protein